VKLELPAEIRLPQEEIDAFLKRVLDRLGTQDHGIAQGFVEAVRTLVDTLGRKDLSVQSLRELVFGSSTETLDRVLPEQEPEKKQTTPEQPKRKRKGHGRNGASAFPGATKVRVPHGELRVGDACPSCTRGKIYDTRRPRKDLRFEGQPPVKCTAHECESLRCNLCGEVFTAELPEEAGTKKYDETVPSVIALLKYGNGFPFYRLAQLQSNLGVPLPAGTQWELVEERALECSPVFEEFLRQGAQGYLVHNDDTTMKILELERKDTAGGQNKTRERTGVFTSGIVSVADGRQIALFFTGRKHAGENLTELLQRRESQRGPPLQMCDGLPQNLPKELKTVVSNCIAHGRRRFVKVASSFPDQVRHVLKELGRVYRVDARARWWKLSAEQRLALHQKYSKPVMDKLEIWLKRELAEKRVEPNSTLGDAIQYFLKHWEPMTLFLREPGAALDNNLVERALKTAILNRKNAYFYKTQHGAEVGDLFMSLIHTARLSGVNAFEYLTVLGQHAAQVRQKPSAWLPWNYHEALAALPNS
jgi:hypothetical protein